MSTQRCLLDKSAERWLLLLLLHRNIYPQFSISHEFGSFLDGGTINYF